MQVVHHRAELASDRRAETDSHAHVTEIIRDKSRLRQRTIHRLRQKVQRSEVGTVLRLARNDEDRFRPSGVEEGANDGIRREFRHSADERENQFQNLSAIMFFNHGINGMR